MKRLSLILVTILAVAVFAFTGCKDKEIAVQVYVPDGAPALSIAKLMHDKTDLGTGSAAEFHVIASDDTSLKNAVAKKPDFIVLPINTATTVAESGRAYQLISVLTHGNLYIVGKKPEGIETVDLKYLSDNNAKLGVVQLAKVPGLTLQAVLKEKTGISYTVGAAAEGIQLIATDGAAVGGQLKQGAVDFALVPEPAATNITTKAVPEAEILMSLHELYGSRYPQAALLAKKGTDAATIEKILTELELAQAENWLETNITDATAAITAHLDGLETSTAPANLDTVRRCNISCVRAGAAKEDVVKYINKIRLLDSLAADEVALDSAFFYAQP